MELPARKPDRRVIKTRRAIRTAFAQLVSEKDIGSITIKDIADRADINRKTFYNYYDGIYSIVGEIEDEMISAFEVVLKDTDFTKVLQNPYQIFNRMATAISKDVDFYAHLFHAGRRSSLIDKVVSVLKVKIKDTFSSQISVDTKTLDLMADFIISGGVAAFQGWFASDYSRGGSVEDFSARLSILITRGVNGLLAADAIPNRL